MPPIKLGYNAVPRSAGALVRQVWRSGQFSPGPMVREFEKQFASAHGAKHAVFVNSGTDALRLSLLALKEKYKWPEGSQVAVPSLTFVATVNTIIQAGLTPFFVDVDMSKFLLNPDNLLRRVQGQHTRLVAIMPVHLFGQACPQDVFDVAVKLKLKVVEDSCETILNTPIGDVSCHSTYMAHHLTTGVGGFAVTNDDRLNLLIRSYANHGRNVDYLPGYAKGTDIRRRFQFDRVGYSCRGTEFEAALGLSQIPELKRHVQKRRAVFSALKEALSGVDDLYTLDVENNTCMMFPIVIRDWSKRSKHKTCLWLEKNGVETRDMMPITSQPCYKGLLNEDDFLVSEWVNKKGFYIPCHPGMTKKDVHYIKALLVKNANS